MIKFYSNNANFNNYGNSVYLPVIIDGQIYLEYVPDLNIAHRSNAVQSEIRGICIRCNNNCYIMPENVKGKKRQLVYKMDKNVVVGVNNFDNLNEEAERAVKIIKRIIEENTETEIGEEDLKEVEKVFEKYN